MDNENDKDEFLREQGSPEGGNGEEAPLDSGRPAVAAAPGRMIFVLLLAAIFIFIVVRSLFFGSTPQPSAPVAQKQKENVAPSVKQSDLAITSSGLPALPPILQPVAVNTPAPPPPPPPPVLTPPTPELHSNSGPSDEALKARIHSSMLIASSGNSKVSSAAKQGKTASNASNDPNSAFAAAIAQSDGADRVEATRMSNLNITIAQGKMIHAVLETAINSDLPGPIRAIVSHDIYAEAGRDILIPKGSRIIGTYNSAVRHGQARVFVIWTRVIRPDGIDIAINSPGTDTLGRAGMGGFVDNKYLEMFSTAILSSTMDIGVAAVAQGLFGNQQQTTTTGGGSTTTTSSPTTTATQDAVTNMGDVGKSIVGSTLNLAPTITIDQGTPLEVYVNHDLIFPTSISSQSHFVE